MASVKDLLTKLSMFDLVDHSLVSELCQGYANATCQRILRLSGSSLCNNKALLMEAEEVFDRTGATCWRPEIGHANTLADSGGNFAESAVLQFIAALALCGWSGEFEVDVRCSVGLLVGSLRVRCYGPTTLKSNGNEISIGTQSGSFAYKLGSESRDLPMLRQPTLKVPFSVAAGYSLDPEMLTPDDWPVAPESFGDACMSVDKAIELLETSSTARDWVTTLTREISLVGPKGRGVTSSRSVSARPGNVLATAPAGPVLLAEALVHESAHQYFGLGARLGPFERADRKDELFFSAINGMRRPIGRLILALHAIANMYAFLDRVSESKSAHAKQALGRLRDLGPVGSSLAKTIAANRSAVATQATGFVDSIIESTFTILRKYDLVNSEP